MAQPQPGLDPNQIFLEKPENVRLPSSNLTELKRWRGEETNSQLSMGKACSIKQKKTWGCKGTSASSVRSNIQNGAILTRRDRESYFYFLCAQKVFSSLHKIQIEPLMADWLPWWCFSYFSEPQQWYLLGSRWDSHNCQVTLYIRTWLTYLYNKLFKTCILPFNFEHPVI